MLADDVAFVVGVDTHADEHALALVEASTQRLRRRLTIAATQRGYRQALRLVRRQAPGRRAWALEGSGCYGASPASWPSGASACSRSSGPRAQVARSEPSQTRSMPSGRRGGWREPPARSPVSAPRRRRCVRF
jgi:hypothetical protein